MPAQANLGRHVPKAPAQFKREFFLASTNQIAAKLREQFESGQPLYLLIDPIVGDFLPQLAFSPTHDAEAIRGAREKAFNRSVFSINLSPDIKLPPSHHPYLVEMTSFDDPWISTSLELATAQNESTWVSGIAGDGWAVAKVGGWLQSAMPADALAAQLAHWMRLDTEVRTEARYLRLADSRVLALLAFVLGRDQVVGTMGGMHRWFFMDAYGRLDSLCNSASGEVANESLRLPRLDERQWQIMQNGAVIHGAIAKAWGERRKESGSEILSHTEIPYAAAAAAAEVFSGPPQPSLACTTLEDRCTAMALALLHPGWSGHVEVKRHLTKNADEYTLADLGQELHEILTSAAAADSAKATLGNNNEL